MVYDEGLKMVNKKGQTGYFIIIIAILAVVLVAVSFIFGASIFSFSENFGDVKYEVDANKVYHFSLSDNANHIRGAASYSWYGKNFYAPNFTVAPKQNLISQCKKAGFTGTKNGMCTTILNASDNSVVCSNSFCELKASSISTKFTSEQLELSALGKNYDLRVDVPDAINGVSTGDVSGRLSCEIYVTSDVDNCFKEEVKDSVVVYSDLSGSTLFLITGSVILIIMLIGIGIFIFSRRN